MEVKIPGELAEIFTALIEMALPLVFVTVKAPALDMFAPGLTLILTLEVTVTLTWAWATPANPLRQQAITKIGQKTEYFTPLAFLSPTD